MVGERGFEPPASRSRTVRSAVLSYSPVSCDMLSCRAPFGNTPVGHSDITRSFPQESRHDRADYLLTNCFSSINLYAKRDDEARRRVERDQGAGGRDWNPLLRMDHPPIFPSERAGEIAVAVHECSPLPERRDGHVVDRVARSGA